MAVVQQPKEDPFERFAWIAVSARNNPYNSIASDAFSAKVDQ